MKKRTQLTTLLTCLYLLTGHTQLYINEWMAANDNVIADNAGEYDDWIEIYNAGTTPVNLAGYYLTDDASAPPSWQIPATNAALTTVPPNGFLLLWADDDTDQGPHHLPFKLSSSGEPILLTDPDGSTLVDEVVFGQQNSNVSYGRATDGSSTLQFFINATPGASNNTSTGPATYNAIFKIPVTDPTDDAEQPFGQNYTVVDHQTLKIVNNWSGNQTIGIRFQNVPIPAGAAVNNAQIQFTNALPSSSNGPSDLTIRAQLSNNSATFVNEPQNITNRPQTAASVNWQPPDWNVFDDAGPHQRTPDLSMLLQQVIDLPGWTEGNAASFIITGSGTRTVWSADNPNSDFVPHLLLEAELPAPTTPVQNLVINEIAARGTIYADEAGQCDDWIELYNAGTTAVNIGGLFLTDDLNDLSKWQIASSTVIPPGGFQTIWTDGDPEQGGLHASFKLSGSGESVALVQWINDSFTIIDQVNFGALPFQASYGRTSDGATDWTIFGEITPAASNNGALPWLPAPTIDLPTGGYNNTQTVALSHPNPDASIYYTTDGTEPDQSATLYTTPISISENTSLKARAFAPGYVESASAKAGYLIGESLQLPSMYINTDPAYFFDDYIGIYVEGLNGTDGFCQSTPANWNQDWEVPVNLSMILEDGSLAFSVDAGAKIGGGCSRALDMKSLNMATRATKYGSEKIDYPLFEGRDHQDYRRIKLRNSGQDYVRLGFRDGILHSLLWDKVDVELQGYQPSVVYLNGEFWGIHNIRELYTDEFFEAVYGIDKKEIDIIKNPNLASEEVKRGDNLDYLQLYSFFENNDFSLPANFQQADSLIDLNEFTNYWISMTYTANADWPANNIIVWKEKREGAKWRYAVMDMDNSTANGYDDKTQPDFNTLAFVTDPNSVSWPNHKNSTLTFRKMLGNENFRNEFIQRTCSFIHLIYDADRVTQQTDSIQGLMQPYVQQHLDKWNADNALGGNIFSWQGWIDDFVDFFAERPTHMRSFINDQFALNGTYELLLNYDANTAGVVNINSNQMATPYNYTGRYFKEVPVRVTAVAKPNYTFAYWLETGDTDPAIDFVSNEDATLTPIFELAPDLGADTSLCEGSTLLLDATVPDCNCSYEWSDGSASPQITVVAEVPTTYSVTVTDAFGTSGIGEILIGIAPAPSATAESTPTTCPGALDGSIDVELAGGADNHIFLWSNGATTEDLFGLAPADNYAVTITGSNGCSTIVENIEVTAPDDIGTTVTSNLPAPGDSNGSIEIAPFGGTPPYDIVWFDGTTGPVIDGLPFGSYAVTITDVNGCSYEEVIDFFPTGETELHQLLRFEVLPNPASSQAVVHLAFSQREDCRLIVYNHQGRIVQQYNYRSQQIAVPLEVHDWAAGIYLLELQLAQGRAYQRVVVR